MGEKELTISCIIATHYRDDLLEEAIKSILEQSCLPLEIIVSDNTQSQSTLDIVKRLNEKASIEIMYIGHDQGGRGCISRNIAAAQAKGDLLAFLDDDDMWQPMYLEKMLALKIKSRSNAVYSWFANYRGKDFPLETNSKKLVLGLKPEHCILNNRGTIISNLVVERNVFLSLGGFDENVIMPYDKDFIIQLLRRGHLYSVLEEPLVLFRQQAGHQRESAVKEMYAKGQWALYNKNKEWLPLYERSLLWIKAMASRQSDQFSLLDRLMAFFFDKLRKIGFLIRNITKYAKASIK